MRLRIALSLAMAIAGAAAILGAPSIPMRHVAAVVVAAGCLALAMSVTILATLRAPRVTAFAICTVTATALVLAVALVDLVTPYRNNRTGRSVELWDPRENALDQFETLNFSYNRQGWRTAREAEAFRAGHDILLLGDSVAFGIVSDGQTIESHLRHMLTQARAERDTSTLAVPGVGLTTYQALSEIAAPMRPAWAYLFIYVDNDFTHSVEFDLPWVARILYTSPSLRALSELPTLLWGLLDRAAQPPAAPAAPPEGATLPE